MNLFKRILLSFFPENIINQPVNPASMFVSFISAKQFFSVINRKIVENYKLNLFDISLDSFDVKIWFWEQPTIKVKDIDFYYGYGVSANLNWYRFLAPWNLWNSIALVSCLYVKNDLEQYNNNYLIDFVVTIYLITFIFISRLKVFPNISQKESYNWFIDVFFEFYFYVISQNNENIDLQEFEQVKIVLLKNIQLFFMLFYFFQSVNNVFSNKALSSKEYYSLLFYDELQKWAYKTIVWDFIDHSAEYTIDKKFNTTEKKLFNLIFPADILIKYIFEEDTQLAVDTLVSNIYDKDILDNYMSSFLKSDKEMEKFILYITDYNHFKRNYFPWLKNLVMHKFKSNIEYDTQESLDELLSSVWEWDNIENIKIPDRIKKESVLMEKFINFYVTYIWSHWISRWDNFFIRLFRKNILTTLINKYDITELKQDALFFYGALLYNYSKNVFYYKYAFDNVRAWKEKFNLPFRSTFRQVYSNMYIIKLFNENFLANILQDINTKDIKIYLHNKEILGLYKSKTWEKISKLTKLNNKQFLNEIYWKFDLILKEIKWIDNIFYENFSQQDVENLKENLYTLDFRLWNEALMAMYDFAMKPDLSDKYSDFSILWIVSVMRDTLFWILLYTTYLLTLGQENNKVYNIQLINRIYCLDVLWVSEEYVNQFLVIIDILSLSYFQILKTWINIDDNKEYLSLAAENWQLFIDWKSDEKILTEIAWEDIIWFKWFLKNITYYNKRYLIPKS